MKMYSLIDNIYAKRAEEVSPVCSGTVVCSWFTACQLFLSACVHIEIHESLWNTPISSVALPFHSHDFTSKCMPRHDDWAQTLSPLDGIDVNLLLFCFVSYAEISTTRYSGNCVCSFLEPDHKMSNYFTQVTYWFNSVLSFIPVNSSHPTRHSGWFPFRFETADNFSLERLWWYATRKMHFNV